MAENGASAAGASGNANNAGMAYYEQQRTHVKDLTAKIMLLRRQLAQTENALSRDESEYLENTPQGNILTGFDNYTKGTSGSAAQRRRTGPTEQNRVFSRSSISYNADAATPASAVSTPGAPTPVSTSFATKEKEAGSNQPTPTSATEKKGPAKDKKKKEKAPASAAAADDSENETDTREGKKVRVNFGAARK